VETGELLEFCFGDAQLGLCVNQGLEIVGIFRTHCEVFSDQLNFGTHAGAEMWLAWHEEKTATVEMPPLLSRPNRWLVKMIPKNGRLKQIHRNSSQPGK
jgi:hypothetical protein